MNDLQKLFRLRGETMAALGAKIGFTMFAAQKAVKGYLPSPVVRPAIVAYLNRQYRTRLTVDQVFGPDASRHLQPLINKEIERQAEELRQRLQARPPMVQPRKSKEKSRA